MKLIRLSAAAAENKSTTDWLLGVATNGAFSVYASIPTVTVFRKKSIVPAFFSPKKFIVLQRQDLELLLISSRLNVTVDQALCSDAYDKDGDRSLQDEENAGIAELRNKYGLSKSTNVFDPSVQEAVFTGAEPRSRLHTAAIGLDDLWVKTCEFQSWQKRTGQAAGVVFDPFVRRKRSPLINELSGIWRTVERDLRDGAENGLSKRAKLDDHGYWNATEAITWAVENGKIQKKTATSFVASNQDSEFSNILKQLFQL